MNNEKNRVITDLKLNLLITIGVGILSFLITKYFAEYMGVNNLGLMRLFTQMVAYLNLAELGIASASAYALYKPLMEKNVKQINRIISTIESFYKKISISILLIGLLLNFSLFYFIDNYKYSYNIHLYWSLYVINTSITYLFAKYSILFTANQEYQYVRKIQGFGKIIFQLLQILILIKYSSFSLFIVLMIFENIYSYYFYKRHFLKYYNYIEKVKEREADIIKDMKNLFWHKIGALAVYNTDYIVLSKFISLSIVGIYSSYLIIYQMVMTVVNIITPVLTPRIGLFIAKNSKDKIYLYWKELYLIYNFLASIAIICTYKLILPFVNLWLGKEFILSKITVILILINLFISLSRGVTDIFKDNSGFFDDTYVPALEAILNLIFSIILVQKIGLNGVIIGTIISNILIIVLLKPILVFKRCFEKNMISYIKDLIKSLILVVVSIILVNFILDNIVKVDYTNINSWIDFIYKSLVTGTVSLLIILIIFSLDKNFKNFLEKNIVTIFFLRKKT